MAKKITLESLLAACEDDSFDDGIRIDTELEPLSGPGGRVKPAVYEGGTYQMDRRWAAPADEAPTSVIVIDNVPSQANRLEEALRRHRESIKIPELVLDLSDVGNLPAHLPRRLSSLGVLAMLSVAPALHAQSNCRSGTAVSNPTRNPGLVADCEALLTALDDLRGTSLNWSGEPVDAVQAYRAARHDHHPRVDGASRTR